MTFKVIGYAKCLTVHFVNPALEPETLYIEASGKRLCTILATLEARRLKEYFDIEMVVVGAEFLTVTKEFEKGA